MTTDGNKIDFVKSLPSYSAKKGRFDIVAIPTMRYVAADAEGAPEDASFGEAVGALFPLAYALKFASKRELGRDYGVPPLEALWWSEDLAAFTTSYDRSKWRSTALIMLPEWITEPMVDSARDACAKKAPAGALERVRIVELAEDTCGQTLHLGPFAEEGPTIDALHRTISDAGLALTGKHHEIYLSDFRRTEPQKLKTIIRQPAGAAASPR